MCCRYLPGPAKDCGQYGPRGPTMNRGWWQYLSYSLFSSLKHLKWTLRLRLFEAFFRPKPTDFYRCVEDSSHRNKAGEFMIGDGRQPHGGDAATRFAIRISAKLARRDGSFEIGGNRPRC